MGKQKNVGVLNDKVNSKLLKMLVMTTLVYAVSFTAPMVIGINAILQTSSLSHDRTPGILIWFLCITKYNIILQAAQLFFYKVPIYLGVISNPIIYGITNISYRKAYKNILHSAFKCFKNQDITSSVPGTTEM
jgi:hypothetical protein